MRCALLLAPFVSACTLITSMGDRTFADREDAGRDAGAIERDAGMERDAGRTPDAGCPLRYLDDDGDGFGDPANAVETCDNASYVDNSEDCDDANDAIKPDAAETCDGDDQDCDGAIDEGLVGPLGDPIPLYTSTVVDASAVAVAAQETGYLAAWVDASTRRLNTRRVALDGTADPLLLGPTPLSTADNAHWVRAFALTSAAVVGSVLVVWTEDGGIRAQVFPPSGSPLAPVRVASDRVSFVNVAPVGDSVALSWVVPTEQNVIRTRTFDPLSNNFPGSTVDAAFPNAARVRMAGYPIEDRNHADAIILGIQELDEFFTPTSTRIGRLDVRVADGWDVANSVLAHPLGPPSAVSLARSPIAGSGADALGLFFAGGVMCHAEVMLPSAGPPVLGTCHRLEFETSAFAIRGSLISLLIRRDDARQSLIEVRPDGSVTGAVRDLAVSTDTIRQAAIAVRSDSGLVVYEEAPAAAPHSFHAQRFGCP
jgi:hypothetical protein